MNIEEKNRYIIKTYKMMTNRHYPYRSKRKMTRLDLYNIFNHFGYKTGVEIGVLKGQNAASMFKRIKDLKLYCIDPWSHTPRYENYYLRAKKRLDPCNAQIMRTTSMEAVDKFSDGQLDFVYIDNGFHYFDDAMMDLIRWTPKVKSGGMVAGHDYVAHCGVVAAVSAYTNAHGIAPYFATVLDKSDSFFWVKQ